MTSSWECTSPTASHHPGAWFGWQPPLFDGRQRAFHCSDICFWFYSADVMFTHTGGGKRPRDLSEKMSGALHGSIDLSSFSLG